MAEFPSVEQVIERLYDNASAYVEASVQAYSDDSIRVHEYFCKPRKVESEAESTFLNKDGVKVKAVAKVVITTELIEE